MLWKTDAMDGFLRKLGQKFISRSFAARLELGSVTQLRDRPSFQGYIHKRIVTSAFNFQAGQSWSLLQSLPLEMNWAFIGKFRMFFSRNLRETLKKQIIAVWFIAPCNTSIHSSVEDFEQ